MIHPTMNTWASTRKIIRILKWKHREFTHKVNKTGLWKEPKR